MLEQPAAGDRPVGDAEPRHGRPGGDGLRPLVRREDVREDRQRRGHDRGRTETHQGTRSDQGVRAVGEGGERRSGAEDDKTGHERPAAAEAVSEAAGGEQEPGEDEQVAVHDPLQLARAGAQVIADRRQADVEDGVADRDDEQAEGQHSERLPAPGISGVCGLKPSGELGGRGGEGAACRSRPQSTNADFARTHLIDLLDTLAPPMLDVRRLHMLRSRRPRGIAVRRGARARLHPARGLPPHRPARGGGRHRPAHAPRPRRPAHGRRASRSSTTPTPYFSPPRTRPRRRSPRSPACAAGRVRVCRVRRRAARRRRRCALSRLRAAHPARRRSPSSRPSRPTRLPSCCAPGRGRPRARRSPTPPSASATARTSRQPLLARPARTPVLPAAHPAAGGGGPGRARRARRRDVDRGLPALPRHLLHRGLRGAGFAPRIDVRDRRPPHGPVARSPPGLGVSLLPALALGLGPPRRRRRPAGGGRPARTIAAVLPAAERRPPAVTAALAALEGAAAEMATDAHATSLGRGLTRSRFARVGLAVPPGACE